MVVTVAGRYTVDMQEIVDQESPAAIPETVSGKKCSLGC